MKSLAELAAIRERMKDKMVLREGQRRHPRHGRYGDLRHCRRGTPRACRLCGGREQGGSADTVMVSQTGCIGICQYEPVVEIFQAGKEKVTYVKMTPERAAEVIEKHIKGGKIVEEYTFAAAQNA